MLYMYYRWLLNPSLLAISLGKFSAIHDCSADKPQTKKWGGGGGEAQCFIKMGKNKEESTCMWN